MATSLVGPSTSADTILTTPSSTNSAASSSNTSSSSFAQELLNALETALGQVQGGSSFQIEVTPSSGQNSGGSQITITVTDPASTQPETPSVSAPATSPTPTAVANSTPSSTTAGGSSTNPTNSYDPPPNEYQLYWDAQPPAVQQLQYITDPGQRLNMAEQLADEGYTIDVPIMAWGWDPYNTMYAREQYGYTWVPSALQQPVEIVPGLTMGGVPAYDPNDPPPGSITVTTNFASLPQLQNLPPSQMTSAL